MKKLGDLRLDLLAKYDEQARYDEDTKPYRKIQREIDELERIIAKLEVKYGTRWDL